MILLLTIAYHIIFLRLRILIYYGFFLFLIFLQGVVYPLIFRRSRIGEKLWVMLLNQTLVALTTFYCILKLGGIPYSGGLIFVGLALVFFSLNFKKRGYSIGIFIIYIITVILAGILYPWLSVPPEMTPVVNVSLFVINLLRISGFAMVFVINFISQRVKLEQLESNRLKELVESKTKLYTSIAHESRTQLYRKFRSLSNRTPNDYLRSLRLHKAKDLLTGSDVTVTEAAYRTGFKNLSHFSKVFSEEFGVNPREINK